MNILLLTNHLNIGGLTTYTKGLARDLVRKGHNVYIGSGGGDLSGKDEKINYVDLGLTTKCEFGFKVWRAVYRAIKLIKKEKIDLIHAQTRVTSVVASISGKICKIPFVTTAHGFYRPRIGRFLFPCWGRFAIAISEPVYDHLVNDFYIDPEKVRLIYNGTDFVRFSKSIKKDDRVAFKDKNNIPHDLPVIGTVSRLSPVKGHEYLLEAFYRILKKRKVILLLVGDGPKAEELKDMIQGYKMSEFVRMIPSMESPEVALSVMDLFVLPSLQEGLSLSILEAQASGKPVIATSVGGISQIILDGQTGMLVPPQDVDSLVEKIEFLISNKEQADKIGKAGKERVRKKFNIERMINEVEGVYFEALQDSKMCINKN